MKQESEREIQRKNESKLMRCDRCGTPFGLHIHEWNYRCTACVWNERAELIRRARDLLSANDYTEGDGKYVILPRIRMRMLEKAVEEACKT